MDGRWFGKPLLTMSKSLILLHLTKLRLIRATHMQRFRTCRGRTFAPG